MKSDIVTCPRCDQPMRKQQGAGVTDGGYTCPTHGSDWAPTSGAA